MDEKPNPICLVQKQRKKVTSIFQIRAAYKKIMKKNTSLLKIELKVLRDNHRM